MNRSRTPNNHDDAAKRRYTDARKLFGRLGEFGLLAREIDLGATILGACATYGISRTTAGAVFRELAGIAGVPVVETVPGRPQGNSNSDAEHTKLTDRGREIMLQFQKLQQSTKSLNGKPQLTAPRIAIEGDPFLWELLQPALRRLGTNYRTVSLESPDRKTLEAKLSECGSGLDATIVWSDPTTQPRKGLRKLWADEIGLLLVARTKNDLSRYRSDAQENLEVLARSGAGIAYRSNSDRIQQVCRYSINSLLCQSFADVYFAVALGKADYGLVPALYSLLDRYRIAHGLVTTPVVKGFNHPDTIQVAVLIRDLDDPQIMGELTEQLKVSIANLTHNSRIDIDATHRKLPTTPKTYLNRTFYSAFIETWATEEPVWNREIIRFHNVRSGHTIEDGAHTVVVEAGWIVNESGTTYEVHGGVIDDHVLHLIANETRSKKRMPMEMSQFSRRKTRLAWPQLRAFLEKHSATVKPPADQRVSSFMAFLPYSRVIQGGRVWWGFWIGMNKQRLPLANAIVLSERELSDDELQKFSGDTRSQLMLAVAGPDSLS